MAERRRLYDAGVAEVRARADARTAEVESTYAGLIASVALRTASEVMTAAAERADTVRTVTVNGRATGHEAATVQDSRPHLVSVSVTRQALDFLMSLTFALHASTRTDCNQRELLTNINVDRPFWPL